LRGRGFFLAEKNGDGFQIRPRLSPVPGQGTDFKSVP